MLAFNRHDSSEKALTNCETGMELLGKVSSGRGVEISVQSGSISDQYETHFCLDTAHVTFHLGNPADYIAKWDGEPFRPIPSLNFLAGRADVVLRASEPITMAACHFSDNFLRELEETESGVRLNDFGILAGIESARLLQHCQTMFREALAPGFAGSLFADATGIAIAVEVARYHWGVQPNDRPLRGGLAPWQLKRLESYVHANLSAELSLGELARLLGMSVRHLSRSVRKAKGLSIHQWISKQRFHEARRLLAQTNLPVGTIAVRTGFHSATAFSKAFRASSGYTPSEFRGLCNS